MDLPHVPIESIDTIFSTSMLNTFYDVNVVSPTILGFSVCLIVFIFVHSEASRRQLLRFAYQLFCDKFELLPYLDFLWSSSQPGPSAHHSIRVLGK